MSTGNSKKNYTIEFQKRFIAACGTSNPRVISEYLGISYQAARNYLDGRIPEPKVLVRLAAKSPVSLHWLLTGDGEKYVERTVKTEAEMLASVLSEIADAGTLRKIFELISEFQINSAVRESSITETNTGTRTLTINSDEVRVQKESKPSHVPVSEKGP